MQKQIFCDHVKQFSGIDWIFIGDLNDEAPPLVVLQEDMKTILISEIKTKEEIGLPRGDLILSTMIKEVYSTPFRKGLTILYVCQNKIRFSKNRLEANQFDDFTILEGTKDYFRLHYDEVVFDINWQAISTSNEEQINGSLITNKRIWIVDSHLQLLHNIDLIIDLGWNFVFTSWWVANTLLFKFSNFRSVIWSILSDRISVASYDSQENVVITTQKISLLEPLIMSILSSKSSHLKEELPLVKWILQNLDTEQVSRNLVSKLMRNKCYNSSWFVLQNPLSTKFTLEDKYEWLSNSNKNNELFEAVFGPNKDVINSRNDLAESISFISQLGPKSLENQILENLFTEFWKMMNYSKAFKCWEICGNYSKAVELLYLLDIFTKSKESQLSLFREKMNSYFNQETRDLIDIIDFGKKLIPKKKSPLVFSFNEGARTPLDLDLAVNEDEFSISSPTHFKESDAFDIDISKLNRLDLGFDQQAFTYEIRISKYDNETETLSSLLNDNADSSNVFSSMEHSNIPIDANVQMINEENTKKNNDHEECINDEETYDGIEEENFLVFLWRFDQGAGSIIVDLTNNKLHGNILKNKALISNEEAEYIWK